MQNIILVKTISDVLKSKMKKRNNTILIATDLKKNQQALCYQRESCPVSRKQHNPLFLQ